MLLIITFLFPISLHAVFLLQYPIELILCNFELLVAAPAGPMVTASFSGFSSRFNEALNIVATLTMEIWHTRGTIHRLYLNKNKLNLLLYHNHLMLLYVHKVKMRDEHLKKAATDIMISQMGIQK